MSKKTREDDKGSALLGLLLLLIAGAVVGGTVYVVLTATNQQEQLKREASYKEIVQKADTLINDIDRNIQSGRKIDTRFCYYESPTKNKDLVCSLHKQISYELDSDEQAAQLTRTIVGYVDGHIAVTKKIDPVSDITDRSVIQQFSVGEEMCEVMTVQMQESVMNWVNPSDESSKKRTASVSVACKTKLLTTPVFDVVDAKKLSNQ